MPDSNAYFKTNIKFSILYLYCFITTVYCVQIFGQIWNSSTTFLVEVSRRKIKYSQTRVFVWFSILIDSSFLVSRIFCKDLSNQRRYGFL
jgi:hypothetical protein